MCPWCLSCLQTLSPAAHCLSHWPCTSSVTKLVQFYRPQPCLAHQRPQYYLICISQHFKTKLATLCWQERLYYCGSAVLLTHTLLFLQPVKQLFAWETLFVQRQTSPMAANHTAMFEVLYHVRQLISLTHKFCQGRNMPSHKNAHTQISRLYWC